MLWAPRLTLPQEALLVPSNPCEGGDPKIVAWIFDLDLLTRTSSGWQLAASQAPRPRQAPPLSASLCEDHGALLNSFAKPSFVRSLSEVVASESVLPELVRV
eukprot:361051-Chlamydomonas_euryale.AAC.1